MTDFPFVKGIQNSVNHQHKGSAFGWELVMMDNGRTTIVPLARITFANVLKVIILSWRASVCVREARRMLTLVTDFKHRKKIQLSISSDVIKLKVHDEQAEYGKRVRIMSSSSSPPQEMQTRTSKHARQIITNELPLRRSRSRYPTIKKGSIVSLRQNRLGTSPSPLTGWRWETKSSDIQSLPFF